MKIPFDIAYRSFIESGEYKVETRDGKSVRIVCWDRLVAKPSDNCNIVALVTRTESESTYYYYQDGHLWNKANGEPDSPLDLFIIISEPELTEFEQELVNFFNERNAILPDKDGVYNKHDCYEFLHKSANKLLAIARKEFQPEIDAEIEKAYKNADKVQYEKGRADAMKEYEKLTFHYPIYKLCFNGGVCFNPTRDCTDCSKTR